MSNPILTPAKPTAATDSTALILPSGISKKKYIPGAPLTARQYIDTLIYLPSHPTLVQCAASGLQPLAVLIVSYLPDCDIMYEEYPGAVRSGITEITKINDKFKNLLERIDLLPMRWPAPGPGDDGTHKRPRPIGLMNERAPDAQKLLGEYNELRKQFHTAREAVHNGFDTVYSEYQRVERLMEAAKTAGTTGSGGSGGSGGEWKESYAWCNAGVAEWACGRYWTEYKIAFDAFSLMRQMMGHRYNGSPSGPANGLWPCVDTKPYLRSIRIED